ncbi:MAG: DUF1289 domain-containing protein [Candidatus Pseudothioglobus sp.]|jgi:predicted Fe-S protein YdhL (DUF1289 family)
MNEQTKLRQIISPCVSICKYNKNNFCVGCNRHMNEIFDWFDFSDEMRTAIMKDLANRDIGDSA